MLHNTAQWPPQALSASAQKLGVNVLLELDALGMLGTGSEMHKLSLHGWQGHSSIVSSDRKSWSGAVMEGWQRLIPFLCHTACGPLKQSSVTSVTQHEGQQQKGKEMPEHDTIVFQASRFLVQSQVLVPGLTWTSVKLLKIRSCMWCLCHEPASSHANRDSFCSCEKGSGVLLMCRIESGIINLSACCCFLVDLKFATSKAYWLYSISLPV